MKSFLQNIFFSLVAPLSPGLGDSACIFMYHSVGENGASFTTKPSEFKRQMTYLMKKNYTIVHLSELIRRLESGESIANVVCVTFDDGYKDNFTEVFPTMRAMQIPISFFLTTGGIGGTQTTSTGVTLPMLSESHIREMHESGLAEFLPHGHEHLSLNAVSKDEARKEVVDSVVWLEHVLGPIARIFCYPKGKYTSETISVLKGLEFRAAVTVRPGLVDAESLASSTSGLFELPRVHVDAKTSFAEFRGRLRRAGEWYESLKPRVSTVKVKSSV